MKWGFIAVFHMIKAWKFFGNSTINSRTKWLKFFQKAIRTKFAPLYACIFMDCTESSLTIKLFDNFFFNRTDSEEN